MFPVTITLNNAEQLNAVMAAMNIGNAAIAKASAKTEAVTEKKQEQKAPAATAPAATQATAAATDAPAAKAETSAAILDKDALTSATKAAIAKVGREEVVALIASYGAAKGSEIAVEKRAEFDAKLLALAA